ncbi:Rpr2-domain-containing protein [Pisolithus croceorrhizus]|nr:Rpr2-domain-containing protein [Pisolithus croceorrhizus]KAI6135719.1 Rpr2-domain-containing protein [Pisolithus croceorrhizus]
MVKNKGKHADIPNPNHISNKDIIQRLNFLYQASALLGTISPNTPVTCHSTDCHQPRRRRVVTISELSRSYVDTMKIVGQKTNTKIDPSVKRSLCKNCSSVLAPGISATVRVKNSASHHHLVSYVCHACRSERRIPAPPVLPDNVMEVSCTDQPPVEVVAAKPRRNRRRRRGPVPRPLPHFARDVGHVVFRGNQIISGVDLECNDAGGVVGEQGRS